MLIAPPLTPAPPPPYPLPLPDVRQGRGLPRCLAVAAPVIQQARERVRRGARDLAISFANAPFSPDAAEEMLASPLAQQLLMMMARVLVLELNVARLEGVLSGDTPEERFDSFVSRLQKPGVADQLFNEYPVLLEQVVNTLNKWAAFSLEFLRHLCEDWTALRQTLLSRNPGKLAKVHGGAGDTHRNGRSVMIVSFENGSRVVYKPRSLSADEHFQQLLTWLNSRGAHPQFQTMKILSRDSHGWSEFIEAKSCDTKAEISRFYQRQGGYLAVLYALNASDFHFDNVIARGEHPFLIDLEALFHQHLDHPAEQSEHVGISVWSRSVLRVALLPSRIGLNKDCEGLDLGGLSNPAGQLTPRAVPHWDRADTDEMHMVRRRAEMSRGKNSPALNGQDANAFDYAGSILSGFRSTYRLLLQDRSGLSAMLDSFSSDEVRVIARATQVYGTLLSESFHPDMLRDRAERLALFERLREAAAERPVLNRLVEAECRDLLNGDIPLFTTRPGSRGLWTSSGDCIGNVFDDSAIAVVRRQLLELSEEDLERQTWIVRASLATLSSQPSHASAAAGRIDARQLSGAPEANRDELLSTACAIGDRLSDLAIRENGAATWMGLPFATETHRYVAPLGFDLYDGLPGVILFLAYLDEIAGQGRYSGLVKSGLNALDRQIGGYSDWGTTGGFAGWGGVLYALTHIGAILKDASLLPAAESLVDRIERSIASDDELDIIGGSAGCALALRSLHHVRPSGRLIEIARACGERLLETVRQTDHGAGWLCAGSGAAEVPLTGFAHGNAGIAYALLTIAELTGDPRFRETACAAIQYERALFSPARGNWPDLRNHSHGGFVTAWCHGAPGIGLSRLNALRYLDDPLLREEIGTALSTTLRDGFGGSHTLCHGDLGNVDILLHAGETLNEPRWSQHARQEAAKVVAIAKVSSWNCGHPLAVETPGLMTGLAGIGYALLRLAEPRQMPCVLALDPPKVSR